LTLVIRVLYSTTMIAGNRPAAEERALDIAL
jgi:hypothetical protein